MNHFGSAALLRIAALPLSLYGQGGAPALFDRLRELDAQTGRYRALASHVAEDLGRIVVPSDDLSGKERADVLSLRRLLHRGETGSAGERGRDLFACAAAAARRVAPRSALPQRLAELAHRAAQLDEANQEADAAVAGERDRLAGLPWRLLQEHPAGRLALAGGDIAVAQDIQTRLASGEPWTTKRMRRRSDYLWRMIARASARATPRGWLVHVAPILVQEQAWNPDQSFLVTEDGAYEVVGNIDDVQAATALETDAAAIIALAPLTWRDEHHVAVWTLRGETRTRLVRVTLRRTPVLDAVWDELAGGAVAVKALVAAIAGSDAQRTAVVRAFIAHLVTAGVLQATTAPQTARYGWRALSTVAVAPTERAFADVYRRTAAPLLHARAADLAAALDPALRVMACADRAAAPQPQRIPAAVTEEPRALLDVVADCVNAGEDIAAHVHRHDWPDPASADPSYCALHGWLTAHMPSTPGAGGAAEPLDVDAALLDACKVPDQRLDWPTDVLLSPIAGASTAAMAVLRGTAPAGVLDARFLPALDALGAPVPQTQVYKRFLDRVSELTGVRFVELLVPPLSRQAANAVRRPRYTPWWTGDPDPSPYYGDDTPDAACHLPLSQITIRRDGDSLVAEHGGQRIWPLMHTARVTRPPWDTVRALLSRASPQAERRTWRPLTHSLPGWPDRDFVPRITVGGGRLVLTAAQWRIPPGAFGRPDDRVADRARALACVRRDRGLPRWVTVCADPHDEPVAVDLDSLQALRVLDHLSAGAASLIVSELIPGPQSAPVLDAADGAADGHLAELLLRLPFGLDPEQAAAAFGTLASGTVPGTVPGGRRAPMPRRPDG